MHLLVRLRTDHWDDSVTLATTSLICGASCTLLSSVFASITDTAASYSGLTYLCRSVSQAYRHLPFAAGDSSSLDKVIQRDLDVRCALGKADLAFMMELSH